MRLSFAFALALLAISCAPKHEVVNPSPFEEDDPAARPTRNQEPAAEPQEIVELAPEVTNGTIARGDYEQVIKKGPGHYMRRIAVEAVMHEVTGVLRGWQVVAWPYESIDLRQGDVVLDINGSVIVRPDDLATLWESLAGAETLAIRIERDGLEATLHFDIGEPGDAPEHTPSAASRN